MANQSTKRRGIGAAEKYAELEAAGLERPRCECHGESKLWVKDKQCIAGGYWGCRIKSLDRRYRWIKQNPERARESSTRYEEKNRIRRRERRREIYWSDLEKARANHRNKYYRRVENPEYRRRMSVYMILYKARRKREEYGNKGYTLGDYGQEGSGRRDRTAA